VFLLTFAVFEFGRMPRLLQARDNAWREVRQPSALGADLSHVRLRPTAGSLPASNTRNRHNPTESGVGRLFQFQRARRPGWFESSDPSDIANIVSVKTTCAAATASQHRAI
jgi:hypothetical protein